MIEVLLPPLDGLEAIKEVLVIWRSQHDKREGKEEKDDLDDQNRRR